MCSDKVGEQSVTAKKSWEALNYWDRREVCLWYNRNIKQMKFGAFLSAHFQAMFTCMDKTVEKMNAKLLAHRVVAVPTKNSQAKPLSDYTVALQSTGNINDVVLATKIFEAAQNKVLGVLLNDLAIIEKNITLESKSKDVKEQLNEATTNFDKDVNALLDQAVKQSILTKEQAKGLLKQVNAEKEQKNTRYKQENRGAGKGGRASRAKGSGGKEGGQGVAGKVGW